MSDSKSTSAPSASASRRLSEPSSLGVRRPSVMTLDLARLDLEDVSQTDASRVWVIHPFSELRYFWDLIILQFMLYTSVVLPLQFADLIESGSGDSNSLLLVLDQVTNAVFLIDILLNFHTGYLDIKARTVVLDIQKVRRKYLRTWFGPDLLATTPFDLLALWSGADEDDSLRWTFKWLRSLRITRLLRLTRILSRLEVRSGMRQTQSMACKFSVAGLFVAHLSACSWYTVGTNNGTWVDKVARDQAILTNSTAPFTAADGYLAALYWSITTMSTMGYGDIVAGNTRERIFSCIVMVFGSCFYAYGITSVITSMAGVNEHERRITAQRDQLNSYIATMDVPRELRQKLREYFVHYQNAVDTFNEHNVLQMLSPGLRASLCSLANAPLLRRVSFFREVDEGCVSEMAQLLAPNLFVPDEIIISMGTIGEDMYVIKNGSVLVYLKHATHIQPLATLNSGDFFGEGALLKGRSARRMAFVKSTTYSLIYSLHVEATNRLLTRYPLVQAAIAIIAAQRDEETKTKSTRMYGNAPPRAHLAGTSDLGVAEGMVTREHSAVAYTPSDAPTSSAPTELRAIDHMGHTPTALESFTSSHEGDLDA